MYGIENAYPTHEIKRGNLRLLLARNRHGLRRYTILLFTTQKPNCSLTFYSHYFSCQVSGEAASHFYCPGIQSYLLQVERERLLSAPI